jgi:septum formation protein
MHALAPLYLASSSRSRQYLLTISKIPFIVIEQTADEKECDWTLPLEEVVCSIAKHKMAHVILPQGHEQQIIFVLTADTLSQDVNETKHGKPIDKEDALLKLQQASEGLNRCSTAFCLEKKQYRNGQWHTIEQILTSVTSSYYFDVPSAWRHLYLSTTPSLSVSGAIAIEDFGMQFLKTIDGSYSAIVGLPLFELRQALESMGFFSA